MGAEWRMRRREVAGAATRAPAAEGRAPAREAAAAAPAVEAPAMGRPPDEP